MSDDETRPIEPEAPIPPPAGTASAGTPAAGTASAGAFPAGPQSAGTASDSPGVGPEAIPPYAMPLPAGYPAYAVPAPQQRPRFGDQVLGMWAVVVVAVVCLLIGGLSGWILGHAAAGDDGRFGRGPGTFQRGPFQNGFPQGQNGFPSQPFGQSQGQSQNGR
jgi:hypothetical protein